MNIVLLIVDSLRKQSVPTSESASSSFFSTFEGESVSFQRAYATECWTLPTHLSMFTGLLPSEHGAHFQTMAYQGKAPTIAELLSARGYVTELATRNPVLDGTIPGVARGFSKIELILADYGRGLNPLSIGPALSKPRFRRQIKASGFFTPKQRASREFLAHFARATLPADDQVLAHVLRRLDETRRRVRSCSWSATSTTFTRRTRHRRGRSFGHGDLLRTGSRTRECRSFCPTWVDMRTCGRASTCRT